jgi:hypothetical protein
MLSGMKRNVNSHQKIWVSIFDGRPSEAQELIFRYSSHNDRTGSR